MMDVQVLLWAAGAAIVAGLVVYVVMVSGRPALQEQAAAAESSRSAAESARAVAESRLADLTAAHGALGAEKQQLAEERVTLTGERERLRTSFEGARAELERERSSVTSLRKELEASGGRVSQLEADHRVAKQRGDDLAAEVAGLQGRLAKAETANQEFTKRAADLGAQVSALETERNGLNARLEAQAKWFTEQTQAFEQKIVNMTSRLLEEKSQKFTEVNRKELDAVVNPFKEQLKEFRERVDHIYSADTKDRGQLHEQIRQLTELNQLVSKQAEDLTNALTISSKATGDWGEMILQRILEESGLREGEEYVLQHTVEGAEEDLQRPDAIIRLPDGKQVVVDSKVSNKAWKEYCAAADEETREAKLAEHLAAIRAHMRELSTRDYQHSPDLKTIEFVLMFVPIEAAYLTALSRDEALFGDAWRAKVYIVAPGMLMASLKLIEGMWIYQRRKESADKIAEAGRKLYEKLTSFSQTFVDVGAAIEKAYATYEKAQGQLATGKGHAIGLAQKMVKLGVSPGPGKVMPAALVELADGEDEDDAEVAVLSAQDSEVAEEKADRE